MPDFIAALVHELRTPLTALRGSLGLLATVLPEGADDAREFNDIAARNVLKLASLLDDVAVFARLSRADLNMAIVPCDLALLLEQAAERVQKVAQQRRVSVEVQLPPFDVAADEEMLQDAIARMLFYAVRVTPMDGRVCASAEKVAERVVVRVSDQGRPLQEQDLDRVFDPFSPVARRGVDSADRAMLDLAIAKAVAGWHDGTIEYRQLTGGGIVRMTLGTALAARC